MVEDPWSWGGLRPKSQWGEGVAAEEDVELLGEVGDIDPSFGYITQFGNVVVTPKRTAIASGVAAQITWWNTAQKNWGNCKESRFKPERGDGKEGRLVLSEDGGHPTGHPRWCSPSIKMLWKAPSLNPDLLMWWSGPENIAWVKINDEGSWGSLRQWFHH